MAVEAKMGAEVVELRVDERVVEDVSADMRVGVCEKAGASFVVKVTLDLEETVDVRTVLLGFVTNMTVGRLEVGVRTGVIGRTTRGLDVRMTLPRPPPTFTTPLLFTFTPSILTKELLLATVVPIFVAPPLLPLTTRPLVTLTTLLLLPFAFIKPSTTEPPPLVLASLLTTTEPTTPKVSDDSEMLLLLISIPSPSPSSLPVLVMIIDWPVRRGLGFDVTLVSKKEDGEVRGLPE